MASATDNALKVLLRNRKVFTTVYNPVAESEEVDFTLGARKITYDISFTEGAILRASELKSLLKTKIVNKRQDIYLVCNKVTADIATQVVINGVTYSVKEVIDSFYSTWVVLILTSTDGVNIRSPYVEAFSASDRTLSYLDWLVSETDKTFETIPNDLVLWPIVGWTVSDACKQLYPSGGVVSNSGSLGFKEYGRTSGFTGTGLIDGVAPKRAISYAQSNYAELNSIIDQFNTLMGRL